MFSSPSTKELAPLQVTLCGVGNGAGVGGGRGSAGDTVIRWLGHRAEVTQRGHEESGLRCAQEVNKEGLEIS